MAPYVPDEVNVFNVPHSRMKELVDSYFSLIKTTNFSNVVDMTTMLDSLLKTFAEFKAHEQIENKLIMKKLRTKMKDVARQNAAVCNCHKESKLVDMMHFVEDGFNKSTVQDRINYGLKLTEQLEEFTKTFLPHMQEEEEVFQPLLLEYFTYEELCHLKQAVIQQHLLNKQNDVYLEKFAWSDRETFPADGAVDCELKKKDLSVAVGEGKIAPSRPTIFTNAVDQFTAMPHDVGAQSVVTVNCLPAELVLYIFSKLSAKDLCRCAQVCHLWNYYTSDHRLWTILEPVKWSQGSWEMNSNASQCIADDSDESSFANQHELVILKGISHFVLPVVGSYVKKLVMRGSSVVDDVMLNNILLLCNHVEHLDLSYCNISDEGLKSLHGQSLTALILRGCVNVGDRFLVSCFASPCTSTVGCGTSCSKRFSCMSSPKSCQTKLQSRCFPDATMYDVKTIVIDIEKLEFAGRCTSLLRRQCQGLRLKYLDLSGCWQLSDSSLLALSRSCSFSCLQYLNLSGCYQLTPAGLNALVAVCPVLSPSSLYYCDNIVDGPHSSYASGCQNLQSANRVCCRTGE